MSAVVGLVDYGAGNLRSIANAFEHLGADVEMVRSSDDLQAVSHLVLPGVGAFSHCRETFFASGLVEGVTRWAREDCKPTLGICVGMQLMLEASLEFGETDGLGWFSGRIEPLRADPPNYRVPHVGWSEVRFLKGFGSIVEGAKLDFYFDHSFALHNAEENNRMAVCDHAAPFVAVVADKNLVAIQCHPEKSQRAGLSFLQAFLGLKD